MRRGATITRHSDYGILTYKKLIFFVSWRSWVRRHRWGGSELLSVELLFETVRSAALPASRALVFSNCPERSWQTPTAISVGIEIGRYRTADAQTVQWSRRLPRRWRPRTSTEGTAQFSVRSHFSAIQVCQPNSSTARPASYPILQYNKFTTSTRTSQRPGFRPNAQRHGLTPPLNCHPTFMQCRLEE